MLNTVFRSSWLVGIWMAVVGIMLAMSIATGANLSTDVLLLGVGITPWIVIALLVRSAPSPSVPEILHSVETKDGQS